MDGCHKERNDDTSDVKFPSPFREETTSTTVHALKLEMRHLKESDNSNFRLFHVECLLRHFSNISPVDEWSILCGASTMDMEGGEGLDLLREAMSWGL